MRLANKVAVITGSSRGIGRAIAVAMAKEGAKVVVNGGNQKAIDETVEMIRALGAEVISVRANIADYDQVQMLAEEAIKAFGRIDILINNAGITRDAMLHKMTPEQWKEVIDINLTGVFNCTSIIGAIMRNQGSGNIINISSVVGLYGNVGQTNYSATKGAMISMMKTWAKELGRKGIRANAIAPGFISTEMVETIPENILDGIKKSVPIGRLGTAEEIANVAVFLASDESSYINGETIRVDGGLYT
ncbi:3-oxoacyl-ACP reductase FabG [Zhaonella formicivorans]|uniref:3-oxoacyl-ACP reductase FabG n=1 Tax=Zhaonella formicivorans TaxID=2528593 RepID=UPI0010DF1BC6|nr:3-oxoacyl-ACP reductase FabG [Zhaonella formicivorans]